MANLHGLGMQKHTDIPFIAMLLAQKGSKSRFLMQMFACNMLIFSAIWKVAYFGRICDDWPLCWWISQIWRTLLSRKFIHNVPRVSHFLHVHAPFIYKGYLSSKTIMFFCFNSEFNKKHESFVGINERKRSPNENEFGKAMRHVHVGRICFIRRTLAFMVLFGLLSCLVDSFHSLNSLFKINHFLVFSFAERLRSLSCLVHSCHLFHSLFNNIALRWKCRGFTAMNI